MKAFSLPYPTEPVPMAGMRDILAHQYDRVNIQVVWDAVQTDLPDLLILLKALPGETS